MHDRAISPLFQRDGQYSTASYPIVSTRSAVFNTSSAGWFAIWPTRPAKYGTRS